MNNTLVTGGAGFIGSHIVDELLRRKHSVIVIDNLISGNKNFINKKALFIKADIRDNKKIDQIFKSKKIKNVLHLAGQPSIINAFADPKSDAETNFIGTINVVNTGLKYGVKRFIYASSMTVYGNPLKNPIREDALCQPINYYGAAKYASERFVQITAERNDLKNKFNATSLRMFNVFGPRQSLNNPYQGVLAIFIGNVLRSEPITIYGDGKQARDFIYVKDVATIWVDIINNKKSFNQTINIGSGRKTDILKLAKTVIKACGKNPNSFPINFKKDRPGDQKIVKANITTAQKLLNFNPTYSLQTGLSETLAWAKKDL